MISVQERLNSELKHGKSIAWWACGYYVSKGGVHGLDLKVPIFAHNHEGKGIGLHSKDQSIVRVLISYMGSMMWINVRACDMSYGMGGDFPPSMQGKYIQALHESLLSVTLN